MDNVRRYVARVKPRLKCTNATKKEMMTNLRENMEDILDGDRTVSMKKLYETFGSPKEIAASYLSDLDLKEKKAYQKKKRLRMAIIICLLVVIAIIIYAVNLRTQSSTVTRVLPKVLESTRNF